MKIEHNYQNKADLFAFLHKNNKDIIDMKRASKKMFIETSNIPIKSFKDINKALSTSTDEDTETVIKRTIIGNTYNWLDSHGDVHVDSTFGKSINERQKHIWHLHDHEFKITSKVGTPSKIYEQKVNWSDLGIDKTGTTIALMMDTSIELAKNAQVFNEYKNNEINQHSVGMYYIKISLAMNSEEKEHEEYKKTYLKYIDGIGNKEEVEKQGHFYAVQEAKLIEISAVLEGSNILTPTIASKDIEPSLDTQKVEPSEDTQNIPNSSKSSILYY